MILKKLLGKIMTDMGLITEQQLDEVLQRQREIFEQRALPEKVERAQLVSQARRATDRTPMLGQILKDMGLATEEQLEEALKEQDRITGVYGTIGSAKLGAALEIGSIVNSTLDLAEVLALIMRYVNRVTNSVASTLMVLDDKTGELVFSVPTGPKAERLIDARLAPGKGIAGWVAEHGQPILVPNVREDPRFYAEIDNMSGFETQSILCVPLKAKTKLIGVLEAINKTDGTSFTEEDELLLSIFAYQAAMAIENGRLYGELKNRLEEERQMHERLAGELAERKRTEEALRESEERYRVLFEQSPIGIKLASFDGKVISCNKAMEAISGYSIKEFKKINLVDLYEDPEDRRRLLEVVNRSGGATNFPVRLKRKDGTPYDALLNVSRIRYPEDEELLQVLCIDETERKQAEDQLKRHAAQLTALHQTSAAVSSRLTLEEIFETVVRGLSEAFDYRLVGIYLLEDGMLELKAHVGYTPPDPSLIRIPLEKGVIGRTARTGQPQLVTKVEEDPDFFYGAPGITSEVCVPLKRGDEVLGVLNVESDKADKSLDTSDLELLTLLSNYILIAIENARLYDAAQRELAERRQAEEALRQSEERYRSVVEGSIEGIVVAQDFITQFANQAAAQIFGYSNPEDLIGLDSRESFFAPQERAELGRRASDILSGRSVPIHHGWQAQRKDGRPIWIQSVGSLISWNDKPAILSFLIDITEQRLAEDALKESEESYRELADSIAEVFFAFDEDLRYTYWNKASEEVTGIPAKDALGKTLYEVFPDLPQTRKAEKIYRDVLRTQKSRTFLNEYELGGKYFFFEISVYPSKRGLSVFAKDVTEKKEAEDALRESEERYRSLVQNVPIAVYRTTPGPKGKFLMANPTFLKMFGLDSEEELKKMSVAEVYMNPKDRKAFSDDLLARGGVDTVELPLRRRDGTPFWGSITARVLYDQSEGNPHFDANIVDITERKQAEQALRESEEKYRDLVERANDGITIIQDGHLEFVNQRMAEMVGYTVEEMIDTPFTRYLHPDKISESIGRYERRMAGKVVSPVSENILRHRDGSDIDVEINAGTIMYRGQVSNLVIVRDITERKRAKEELEKSREQLRNLAIHLQSVREGERTAIALEIHDDLGQALTGLKMDLSWLAKKLPRDQRPLLDKTKVMTELTDATIKTVKRLSTELRPGLLDDLGLIAAIEWQADEFQNRTGITCALSVDPADIVLDRDRSTALFRIFQETLTNVARHAHATRVRVSLKEKNGIVELKVGDNGKGITEKQISDPKSFGLMGIRERIHPWGGTVKIKGTPDKGTTVTVSIPVEESGELGN